MPMIDPSLLNLVRCPIDGQRLMIAPDDLSRALNQGIEQRQLRDQDDAVVEEPIDAALVTADGSRAYPVRQSIPTLIPAEAITIPEALRSLVPRWASPAASD